MLNEKILQVISSYRIPLGSKFEVLIDFGEPSSL